VYGLIFQGKFGYVLSQIPLTPNPGRSREPSHPGCQKRIPWDAWIAHLYALRVEELPNWYGLEVPRQRKGNVYVESLINL
jgi:hypothetical protein